MRGGALSICQDRQVCPLTPTLSHWERGQFRIAKRIPSQRHPVLQTTFSRHSRRSAATLHGQIWKPDISAPKALHVPLWPWIMKRALANAVSACLVSLSLARPFSHWEKVVRRTG